MARGKKKAESVKAPLEERETKENKPERQKTFTSSKGVSPQRSTALCPLQEENSSNPNSSCSDVPEKDSKTPLVEVCSPKQEKSDTHLSSPGQKEKSGPPPQDIPVSKAAPLNKAEHRSSAKEKAKKPTKKKGESKHSQQNRKVTDYFPIRRSSRKTPTELKSKEQHHIDYLIRNNVEEGLKVKHIEGKGRGVFAERDFIKGQFIVEYHGDLLDVGEAKLREAEYEQDPAAGCYMYYFRHLNQTYCVDATRESGRLGRLINHSKNGNCQTRVHPLSGVPRLILLASRDIKADEELLYDYGDRSRESLAAHPWLKH